MQQQPDQEVEKALDEGHKNVKFRAPNSPLAVEAKNKFMVPTPKVAKTLYNEWYAREVIRNPQLQIIKAEEDSK